MSMVSDFATSKKILAAAGISEDIRVRDHIRSKKMLSVVKLMQLKLKAFVAEVNLNIKRLMKSVHTVVSVTVVTSVVNENTSIFARTRKVQLLLAGKKKYKVKVLAKPARKRRVKRVSNLVLHIHAPFNTIVMITDVHGNASLSHQHRLSWF